MYIHLDGTNACNKKQTIEIEHHWIEIDFMAYKCICNQHRPTSMQSDQGQCCLLTECLRFIFNCVYLCIWCSAGTNVRNYSFILKVKEELFAYMSEADTFSKTNQNHSILRLAWYDNFKWYFHHIYRYTCQYIETSSTWHVSFWLKYDASIICHKLQSVSNSNLSLKASITTIVLCFVVCLWFLKSFLQTVWIQIRLLLRAVWSGSTLFACMQK